MTDGASPAGRLGAAGALGRLAARAVAQPVRVSSYALRPPGWPPGLRVRIAVLADIHACEPWMPPARIAAIVAQTNALAPDLVALLGDYVANSPMFGMKTPPADWAAPLGRLRAPLGVHAVLGNHDFRDDRAAQRRRRGPVAAQLALEAAGVPVYENRVAPIDAPGGRFWLAGLGDQRAFRVGLRRYQGVDDLDRVLSALPETEPAILLAHEPDIFVETPARIGLTVSGHTHGGQIRPFGRAVVVPSRYGRRYAYGHIVEPDAAGARRHLIVSGGLGCSGPPIRVNMPPEIVWIDLGG